MKNLYLSILMTALGMGFSQAAVIPVASYSFDTTPGNPPGTNYQDTTGVVLTDGATQVQANTPWNENGKIVGWFGQDGDKHPIPHAVTITFGFDEVYEITSLDVWAADNNGGYGIAIPAAFVIRTPDNSFSQTFSGWGRTLDAPNAVKFELGGFSVVTDTLELEVIRFEWDPILDAGQNGSPWVMLSEVAFHGEAIPEPSAALVGLLGLLPLLRRRR